MVQVRLGCVALKCPSPGPPFQKILYHRGAKDRELFCTELKIILTADFSQVFAGTPPAACTRSRECTHTLVWPPILLMLNPVVS